MTGVRYFVRSDVAFLVLRVNICVPGPFIEAKGVERGVSTNFWKFKCRIFKFSTFANLFLGVMRILCLEVHVARNARGNRAFLWRGKKLV